MIAIYGFALVTAIVAQGRTGLFVFLLGTLLVLAIRRRFKDILIACMVLLLFGIAFGDTIQTYLVRGAALETIQSLSGRTEMWQAAWQSFLAHPLVGQGYGVGGRSLFLTTLANFEGQTISSLHNGLLELLTGVGLLGLVPWIVSFMWTIVNAFRSGLAAKNIELCAIMAPVIGTTTMSIGAGGWLDLPLAYFLCCAAILGHGAAAGKRRARSAIARTPTMR
jgi:O-antigen ligase